MHTQNLHSFDIQKKDINMNLINLHCSQVFDGFAKTSTKPLAPDLELGLGSVLLDLYGPGILARFFCQASSIGHGFGHSKQPEKKK